MSLVGREMRDSTGNVLILRGEAESQSLAPSDSRVGQAAWRWIALRNDSGAPSFRCLRSTSKFAAIAGRGGSVKHKANEESLR